MHKQNAAMINNNLYTSLNFMMVQKESAASTISQPHNEAYSLPGNSSPVYQCKIQAHLWFA